MTSLRARILILIAILIAFTLAATSLLSSRFAAERFDDLVRVEGGGESDVRDLVPGWPDDPDSALAHVARFSAGTGRPVVWVRADGTSHAFSHGKPISPAIVPRDDGIEVTWRDEAGGERVLRFSGGAAVPGPHGGRIYTGPAIPDGHLVRRAVSGMNRSLVVAAIAIGLLGAAIAFLLSRRILGPVQALTLAARQMERGDLTVRVPVTSGDELGALAASFNAMAGRIEHTERLRRDLVTDVAHELRTPLTNLKAQIEAIQDGLATSDARTMASLHEEAALLQRIVDDLQDLALAEAGGLRLEPERLVARDLLERAAAAVAARARPAGVEIRIEAPDGLPDARADARRTAQVLRNLLANALTHTPRGGRVALSAASAGGALRFSVRDTGPGIDPASMPKVFERFWRADPSRDRATGGAGLGLAVVQQLVRAQGGDVGVESEPGAGACFWFTLPRA